MEKLWVHVNAYPYESLGMMLIASTLLASLFVATFYSEKIGFALVWVTFLEITLMSGDYLFGFVFLLPPALIPIYDFIDWVRSSKTDRKIS